jgi:hypothetical protein
MPGPTDLTRHHALPRRYLGRDLVSGQDTRGYTGMDLFKFYGLLAALSFLLAYTYTRYLELFTQVAQPEASAGFKLFVVLFTGIPLLLALGAVGGFFWWSSGALVQYTRWQVRDNPRLWRWFWLAVQVFYFIILFDPLDAIHPAMSRKGLEAAPNLVLLFSGRFEWFQFQWGYFLLWALFFFLVAIAHYSYLVDGLKEAWFYTKRVHRYGASVLTGFRGTAMVGFAQPVTLRYPAEQPTLPPSFRGAPRLNVDHLTATQAAAILAADHSGAFVRVPGTDAGLLVDLGRYSYSPQLAALAADDGTPLLAFEDVWAAPTARREELLVPLKRSRGDAG